MAARSSGSTANEAVEGAYETLAMPKTASSFQATNTEPKSRCYFLVLPPELRLSIYELLFSSLHEPFNNPDRVWDRRAEFEVYRNEVARATAILYANKQIFLEAWPTLNQHSDALISPTRYAASSAGEFVNDNQEWVDGIGRYADNDWYNWRNPIFSKWAR